MRYVSRMFAAFMLVVLSVSACSLTLPPQLRWEPSHDSEAQSFRIVVLPDTQGYTRTLDNQQLFSQQTQWIADNLEVENIQFVIHLGDIVDRYGRVPWKEQWPIADAAMSILDSQVPYSVAYGNHDFDVFGNSSGGSTIAQSWFGDSRYRDYSWYGGASPDGENFYQRFSTGGHDLLHFSLKYNPDEAGLDWVESVLDANPDRAAILSTHAYLADNRDGGRAWQGEMIWKRLVKSNDQIFMVIGGHYHEKPAPLVSGEDGVSGEYHQVSVNDTGREVYEILADYQDYPNGGDGWLRLIEFDLSEGSINVLTYSPVLDAFQTDASSQFSFTVDLSSRLRQ